MAPTASIVLLAASLVAVPVVAVGADNAADFQRGLDAYNRGDYTTAADEWIYLAEQGDALAQSSLGMAYGIAQNSVQDNVRAHMWFRISAANENASEFIREDSAKRASAKESEMTPPQIAEAQNLARECVRKNYKGC
ncbi:MAG: hypothetical protein ACKVG0_03065 [Alphaproteobacteria bacterium]